VYLYSFREDIVRGRSQRRGMRHGRCGTLKPVPPVTVRQNAGIQWPVPGKSPGMIQPTRSLGRFTDPSFSYNDSYSTIFSAYIGGMQLDGTRVRRGRQHLSVRVRGVCGISERRLPGTVCVFRSH